MPYKEIQVNWERFSELIEKLAHANEGQSASLIRRYAEQNILMMNDMLTTSIENLSKLQKAKTANDVICMQARFTNEISKKLSLSAQRFLNASLGHIADYNEWLKAHCDLATD